MGGPGGLAGTLGSCPLSIRVSWVSIVGWLALGGIMELLALQGLEPFNCKFDISSTLRSELIEGSRALSEVILILIRGEM